jgi:replicative DNA helicase
MQQCPSRSSPALPVVYFATTDTHLDLALRLVAASGRVAVVDLASGRLSDDDWARVERAADRLADQPTLVHDQPDLTMATVEP